MSRFGPWLVGAAVLALSGLTWGYTVDDAFIVGRFAGNLASGHGYGLDPGQPADGITGPLWVLPGWLAMTVGLDPVVAAKGLGVACAALATALVVRRLARRAGGRRSVPHAVALLAVTPSLATWGAAGLETGAATLLVTVAGLAATRRPRAAPVGCGLAIAALAWLRPELALLAAVLLAGLLLRDRRRAVPGLALALAGALGVVGFRLALFGHALPLSFDAKAGDLGHGVSYTARGLVLATSLVGIGLAQHGARGGRPGDLLLGLALVAHVLAVALAGGDWMPGYRLLTPVLPLYAMLAALGATRLAQRRPLAAALATALACAVPLADLITRLPEHADSARSQARAREVIVPWLRAHARHVALVDAGLLPYYASEVAVTDLGGITDAEIAHLPGGHLDKRIDDALLRARDPDVLLLHASHPPAVDAQGRLRGLAGYPVERRVASLPWVRAHFRVARVFEYRPGYHYVALTRADASEEAPGESDEGHAEQIEGADAAGP